MFAEAAACPAWYSVTQDSELLPDGNFDRPCRDASDS
jgi:hypothetical protein